MTNIVAHGSRHEPRFALSFDDGPGPETAQFLDLLRQRSAPATFFMVGQQVELHPQLARAVIDGGHEVGSHSYAHHDHAALSCTPNGRQAAVDDMVRGARVIERTLGVQPKLYRAPYGHFTATTLAEAERRGWPCVLWSADGCDWRADTTAGDIVERVCPDLGPGAIVLFHDARRERPADRTAALEATAAVLDRASEQGLEPVSVGRLIGVA